MKLLKAAKVLEKVSYHIDGFLISKETGERISRLYGSSKYYRISCGKNNKIYEHRAIWFLTHGYWPKIIDHINGNCIDNRIENLRECTGIENARNRHAKSLRKHELPRNVYLQPSGRYTVALSLNGKTKHIGSFTSIEEAAKAAQQARKEYYGDFAGS